MVEVKDSTPSKWKTQEKQNSTTQFTASPVNYTVLKQIFPNESESSLISKVMRYYLRLYEIFIELYQNVSPYENIALYGEQFVETKISYLIRAGRFGLSKEELKQFILNLGTEKCYPENEPLVYKKAGAKILKIIINGNILREIVANLSRIKLI